MEERGTGWTVVIMSILTVASPSFLTLMPRKKRILIVRTTTCMQYFGLPGKQILDGELHATYLLGSTLGSVPVTEQRMQNWAEGEVEL